MSTSRQAALAEVGLEPQANARRRLRVLTAAIALATFLSILVPRIGPLVAVSVTAVICMALVRHDVRRDGWPRDVRSMLLRREVPFVAWTLVACIWSADPEAALGKAAFLAVLVLHAVVLATSFRRLESHDVEALSWGLLIGFLLGGLYLCVEIATRDGIARLALTHFPQLGRGLGKHAVYEGGAITFLNPANINRVAMVYCLFWCPVVLAATLHAKGLVRWVCYAAIAASSLMIVFHEDSQSQTAQFALLVALACLALAIFLPAVIRWLLVVGFVAWLILIVPASLMMFAAKLHEDEGLFQSARARVIIWNYTAEKVLDHPILGVGTNSTRYLDEARTLQEKMKPNDGVAAAATRAHPHNIYLQIWYELGAVGVLAFGILGVSLLLRTALLPETAVAFGLAHFALCMAALAPAYGLWQNWFQSALVLSILALLAVSVAPRADPSRGCDAS